MCYVMLYNNNNGSLGQVQYGCQAQSSAGTFASCWGTDPNVAQFIASSVKGDSYIEFFSDAAGYCSFVMVQQASYFAPKQP